MRGERTQRERAQTRDRGATAIEYGLLVALIALVMIAAVSLLSSSLTGVFLAAAEPFSAKKSASPVVTFQVSSGDGAFLQASKLSSLQNLPRVRLLSATVDDASKGKVKVEDEGLAFEARKNAKGQAKITYTYSYQQDKNTVTGRASVLVNII
jgi:pilus assembly protein Flp/PilA